MTYINHHDRTNGCVFCEALRQPDGVENLIIYRGQLAYVILNRYPYTSGHLMVLPQAHWPDLACLESQTRAEMMELINHCLQVLEAEYHPQGFNIGANLGNAAGAGIPQHVHFHIVPRWSGDTNFMSAIGEIRVVPEALDVTYHRITNAWLR